MLLKLDTRINASVCFSHLFHLRVLEIVWLYVGSLYPWALMKLQKLWIVWTTLKNTVASVQYSTSPLQYKIQRTNFGNKKMKTFSYPGPRFSQSLRFPFLLFKESFCHCSPVKCIILKNTIKCSLFIMLTALTCYYFCRNISNNHCHLLLLTNVFGAEKYKRIILRSFQGRDNYLLDDVLKNLKNIILNIFPREWISWLCWNIVRNVLASQGHISKETLQIKKNKIHCRMNIAYPLNFRVECFLFYATWSNQKAIPNPLPVFYQIKKTNGKLIINCTILCQSNFQVSPHMTIIHLICWCLMFH